MNEQKIHDRLSSDLPINSSVAIAIVADPYGLNGEQIKVLRSIRDDPLAGMYSRSQINSAQFIAGRQWQIYYEQAEIGSIRAIDPTKEAVDGGRMREPLSKNYSKAQAELTKAKQHLGHYGDGLIMDILGRRLGIKQAAEARGHFRRHEIEYTGRRFREGLETLAVLWGFASR